MDEESTFLGFDLSTQKLKAVQLNVKFDIVATAEVLFDTDLPEFRTSGGVNTGNLKHEFFVQPVMWVKALDIVLDRMVIQGANLSNVSAVGGSAQQHGSLYWSRHGIQTLRNLDPDKFLHLQIDDSAFVLTRTPIWMDSSTESQCMEMEMAIGGRSEMVSITGSKSYPRFTGSQIRKIYQQRTYVYDDTQRISLVSSFLASIFVGDIAPIDYADASGMNLLDIHTKTWSKLCLNACAPDLEERLGQPVPTNSVIGNISNFFVNRFGFPSTCKVAAFSGDNPSALSGMRLEPNWLTISLGTSDTVIMNLEQDAFKNFEEGHVMCHPTDPNQYMGLLCFRNGSLVRDAFKKIEAENRWDTFNQLLNSTPRGNYGNMALHFPCLEIIPKAKGVLRWNKNNIEVSKFSSPETEIRALIEGQMIQRRVICGDMGFHFGVDTKIITTGGASVNKAILQVISDVFNAPVYTQKDSEAALLGAAYRARFAIYSQEFKTTNNDTSTQLLSYNDYISQYLLNQKILVCEPSKDSVQIYGPMFERYRQMVNTLENAFH